MTPTPTAVPLIDAEKLRALADKATPGPYDTMPGSMVRALRGDLAVPMFESRCVIWDPSNDGPTVRDGSGAVQMRKGSEGAKISHGMHREHSNVELVAHLLNSIPSILAMSETLEAQAAEIAQMREALEPFANEAETWWVNVPDNARPWIAEPGNSGGADAEFTVGDLRRAHELYRALTATTPEIKETPYGE